MQSLKKRGNGAVGGENEGSYAICPFFFPGHRDVAAQARVFHADASDNVGFLSVSTRGHPVPHQFRQAQPRFLTPPLYATRPATRPCVSELLPTGMEESAEADLVRVLTELECAASAFSVADGRR